MGWKVKKGDYILLSFVIISSYDDDDNDNTDYMPTMYQVLL